MRWRISAADLFVKVTQRMCPGSMPSSFTRKANLRESARVLPEPAPAMTRTKPSVLVTASLCAAFSPDKMSSMLRTSRFDQYNTAPSG